MLKGARAELGSSESLKGTVDGASRGTGSSDSDELGSLEEDMVRSPEGTDLIGTNHCSEARRVSRVRAGFLVMGKTTAW